MHLNLDLNYCCRGANPRLWDTIHLLLQDLLYQQREAMGGLWTLEQLLLTSECDRIGPNSLYSQQSTNRTIQPSAATA